MRIKLNVLLCLSMVLSTVTYAQKATNQVSKVWSAEKANAWYASHAWLNGSDYIPSTAINQLEMWQADTFDPATIDRELGWA